MYNLKTIQLINQIGYYLRKQKKFDAAIRVFKALQNFQPEHIYHQLGQGLVYAVQGKFDETQFYMKRVLTRQPGHSLGMACLGLAKLLSGHQGWRELLMQAAQNNDGLGGGKMAQEILTAMGAAPTKRSTLSSGSSLVRLQPFGMSMEVAL